VNGGLWSSTVPVPWPLVVLVVLGAVLLALALWSVKRHADPRLDIDCEDPLDELMPSLCGLTHGVLIPGNRVEIFENGAYFDALIADIGTARHSVHFETFLWKEGVLGARLVDALTERARAGVQVRVLLDANGTRKMGRSARRRLKEAGCQIAWYHARAPRNLGVLNRRDHRKVTVLDGRVAYVGGHCIVDHWLGDGQDAEHYRDISVRLTGPVVHAVQSAFSENWVDETRELFMGCDVFPALEPAGSVAVHVARIKPERATPAVKILHHAVLCVARRRLWIQNPYFLPDTEAMEAMAKAVERGVDVRVMVPSAGASDMPIVQHAAHHNFERLLKAGVRIFEYPKTLIHQKLMTVDGVWCAIGSSNFDDRSFEINDEITLGLHDADLARQFEAIFERDAKQCVELRLESWTRRGTLHRLQDRALYLFNEQL
jgi:cardiolipin synthase